MTTLFTILTFIVIFVLLLIPTFLGTELVLNPGKKKMIDIFSGLIVIFITLFASSLSGSFSHFICELNIVFLTKHDFYILLTSTISVMIPGVIFTGMILLIKAWDLCPLVIFLCIVLNFFTANYYTSKLTKTNWTFDYFSKIVDKKEMFECTNQNEKTFTCIKKS